MSGQVAIVLGMSWQPGQRATHQSLETPFKDVPSHLTTPLWSWLDLFVHDPHLVRDIGIAMRMTLDDATFSVKDHARATGMLKSKCFTDSALYLDVVEYVLATQCAHSQHGHNPDRNPSRGLEQVLALANSAYKVRADCQGLEMRTTPEVQQQFQSVVDLATGSAREHLTNAWNGAYSRTSDPVKAYSESIKAVEAALAPIVSPQNLKATLGTMRKDVDAKPSKWKFVIADGANSDGVGTVLALMTLLWEGQTSRHGGVNPTRNETLEEARAAVHLAATLVQYAVSGAFSTV